MALNPARIKYYDDYLSKSIFENIEPRLIEVTGVKGLEMTSDPQKSVESLDALSFLCELYEKVKPQLSKVLEQRTLDRKFIDTRVKALYKLNKSQGNEYLSKDYESILGRKDGDDRVVVGPLRDDYCRLNSKNKKIAPIPSYLQGHHVTLFGPPDSKKMAVNAMNAYHRKLHDEPEIVERLLSSSDFSPMWGADDEDSKTPLHHDLVAASENLTDCFKKSIKVEGDTKGKYKLQDSHLALPIKRFPGLALPCFFMFLNKEPIPLHLYDFALHLFHNWMRPEALVFYVPKIENEEEAAYISLLMRTAEEMIKKKHASYKLASIRLMIVLENPRAVFRVNEIMDNLYPYFVGASLGWHDYLGSTARLFKEDPYYRIPVKADPDIVIKYIKGSHDLLSQVVGPRGGVTVGGMYGILPIDNDRYSESFQITLKGFFRDVITQLKRNLKGFWVAHPDFVRIGLAIVIAWEKDSIKKKQTKNLRELIFAFLDKSHADEVCKFIESQDISGLNDCDPLYARSLIVADIGESNIIANNHPDEVRYNVFQSLQYITDWLSGNGCVALPSIISNTPVRVMDDLATAERSRWEVWHELYHKRFALEEFIKIVFEEYNFIKKDLSNNKKIAQVKYNSENQKWYEAALMITIKLMTDKRPTEFATELLLPFTLKEVRESCVPWEKALEMDPQKYAIENQVQNFLKYFEICSEVEFAKEMASEFAPTPKAVTVLIMNFSKEQIINAASFHGDIGEKKGLDSHAQKEQANVDSNSETVAELIQHARVYKKKFGLKFLVSAKGKNEKQLLRLLLERIENSEEQELINARTELCEITLKRMHAENYFELQNELELLKNKYSIKNAQIAFQLPKGRIQQLEIHAGQMQNEGSSDLFQIASLSKTIAAVIVLETLKEFNEDENTLIQELALKYKLDLPKSVTENCSLCIKHLLSHSALNMHYVKGFVKNKGVMPSLDELLSSKHGYEKIKLLNEPGSHFKYSGAGFLVLESILCQLTKKKTSELIRKFKQNIEIKDIFEESLIHDEKLAIGFLESGEKIESDQLMFPAFAAGLYSNAKSVLQFLEKIASAFNNPEATWPISNETARKMLCTRTEFSCLESLDFMNAKVGLGTFIVEAGVNQFMLHQGANDGFRAVYLYCFKGPNQGTGVSILCSGELNAVLFISEVVRNFLELTKCDGINLDKLSGLQREITKFSKENIPKEELVNIGYKKLIFDAFERDRADKIEREVSENISKLLNKSLIKHAKVLKVSDEMFARAENIFSEFEPHFDPNAFGAQGKIMDSWETQRHNPLECDEVLFEVENTITFDCIYFSTKYHLGNQVEYAWFEILDGANLIKVTPRIELKGHCFYQLKLDREFTGKIFKLSISPDGGLTRVGLFLNANLSQSDGEFEVFKNAKNINFEEIIPRTQKPLSLDFYVSEEQIQKNKNKILKGELYNAASSSLGAKVIDAGDEHYGPASQIISPSEPLHMFDGLETARSRKTGNFEYAVIELAQSVYIESVLLDFSYFKNNNPDYISIHALDSTTNEWHCLKFKEWTKPYAGSKRYFKIDSKFLAKEVKLELFPDGGVNRFKVFARK